jgi:tripartite-type tricarboxylate transporter receptor subunit TctC
MLQQAAPRSWRREALESPRRRLTLHSPLIGILASLAAVLLPLSPVGAQEYPTKPIHVIVGYSAGGGNDLIARVLTPKMAEGLGQPFIIENRPGAQAIIATEYVAKAPPDGYTMLMGPSGPMTMNPATYSKLPYAPLRDFTPVSMIGSFPMILVVGPALPVKSVKELVEYAKGKPNAVNYGASAAPFQLAAELFKQRTGTQFAHIPYKGSGDSAKAVMSGEVTMTISDPPPVSGPIKSGQLRPLAVTAAQRHPGFPDVPTMAEAGIPDMEISLWTGFFVPVGTPPAIVKKLQDEVARVVRLPEMRERLAGFGVDPVGNTSEEFGRIVARDIERWTAVAKAANIKND